MVILEFHEGRKLLGGDLPIRLRQRHLPAETVQQALKVAEAFDIAGESRLHAEALHTIAGDVGMKNGLPEIQLQ